MIGLTKSFPPVFKKLRKYFLEIILLSVAVIITIIALVIYSNNGQVVSTDNESLEASPSLKNNQMDIFVDVSGSVKKPGLYEVSYGARIKNVIDKAGGLTDDADIAFYNRNFNLARIVTDQEKIYIPSILEINNGVFIQSQQTLDYISPAISTGIARNAPTEETNQLISLNSGTVEELDQLPGVGLVTANKIISGRPYTTIEELLTKKAVNKSVFEKIQSQISL